MDLVIGKQSGQQRRGDLRVLREPPMAEFRD
jgi:hypothetical protein